MSEEKSSQEVLRGCPQGRSREEVVSGGPRKVGEEVARKGRGRRPQKKSSQEVSRGVPKDFAREKLWKTRLRDEAVRRGPNRSHERRSASEVEKRSWRISCLRRSRERRS